MKGIVLAGGLGTRLYPATSAVSKQLLPIADKPMIYYALSILIQLEISEIAIICTPRDLNSFKLLLGTGSQFGCSFSYIVQEEPNGIAESFLLAEKFIDQSRVALILGDNIFYGPDMKTMLLKAKESHTSATIFGYEVNDPRRYGTLSFDQNGNVADIVEKPKEPPSPYAVVGLYFYDSDVVKRSAALKPSSRGELEITDLNKSYLNDQKLTVQLLPQGYAWLDTGTFESMSMASQYIEAVQNRQGIRIGCLEEVAYKSGFISFDELCDLIEAMPSGNEYVSYLKAVTRPKAISFTT